MVQKNVISLYSCGGEMDKKMLCCAQPSFEKLVVYNGSETCTGKFMTFFSAFWNFFKNSLTCREISAAVFAYGKKKKQFHDLS